jgi:hypothetical protein
MHLIHLRPGNFLSASDENHDIIGAFKNLLIFQASPLLVGILYTIYFLGLLAVVKMSTPKLPRAPSTPTAATDGLSDQKVMNNAPINGDVPLKKKKKVTKLPVNGSDEPLKKKVPSQSQDNEPQRQSPASFEPPQQVTSDHPKKIMIKKKKLVPHPETDTPPVPKVDKARQNLEETKPQPQTNSPPLQSDSVKKPVMKKIKKPAPIPEPAPEPELDIQEPELEPELVQKPDHSEHEDDLLQSQSIASDNGDHEEVFDHDETTNVEHGNSKEREEGIQETQEEEEGSEGQVEEEEVDNDEEDEDEDDNEDDSEGDNEGDMPDIPSHKSQNVVDELPKNPEETSNGIPHLPDGISRLAKKPQDDAQKRSQKTDKMGDESIENATKPLPDTNDIPGSDAGDKKIGGAKKIAKGATGNDKKAVDDGGKKVDNLLGSLTTSMGDKVKDISETTQSIPGDTKKIPTDTTNKAKDLVTGMGDTPSKVGDGNGPTGPVNGNTSRVGGSQDQGKSATAGLKDKTSNAESSLPNPDESFGIASKNSRGLANDETSKVGGEFNSGSDRLGAVPESMGEMPTPGKEIAGKTTMINKDLKNLPGQKLNGTSEIIDDRGLVVGNLIEDADGTAGKLNLPLVGGSTTGKRDVGQISDMGRGIEIQVQTTKDGTTLTIKIPGCFHQG